MLYLVDCICLVVSGSSNIFTMGSVSDCSCLSWATTSVLFSFRADTGKIKKVITLHKSNKINLDVHSWCPSTENDVKFTAKSILDGVAVSIQA